MKKSLVIVGCGIKFLSHLTIEAQTYIQQADKVLFLVNNPAMKIWIKENNLKAESLDHLYAGGLTRDKIYKNITSYILKSLKNNNRLCIVIYGHPTLFSQPALDAALKARKMGINTKVLPGISAEDCLFADLMINPGQEGYQAFDTTDLLLYKRRINNDGHLILWQVGVTGVLTTELTPDNTKGIKLLVKYLNKFYALSHPVILYEAAQYPTFEPFIKKSTINELSKLPFSPISTVYIPPFKRNKLNLKHLKEFKLTT